MNSIAAGTTPSAMMAATHSPAAGTVSNDAIRVRVTGALRRIFTTTSTTTPSSPSEPVTRPSRSSPPWQPDLPPSVTISPPGTTMVTPSRLLVVRPYFRQCSPPLFSATLPPMVQATWLDGSGA